MWSQCFLFVTLASGAVSIFVSPDPDLLYQNHKNHRTASSQNHDKLLKEEQISRATGHWATPSPDSGIHLGFTPIQTYVSVRRSNTVERLPRSEAYKESTSPDELKNAHRLREVLRTKKIQEVYSEEGFEDSAYDHGHHDREAEFEESFNRNKKGKALDHQRHSETKSDDDSNDAESRNHGTVTNTKTKPKITRKKVESKKVTFSYKDGEKKKSNPKKTLTEKKDLPLLKTPKSLKTDDLLDFPSNNFDVWQSPIKKWTADFHREKFGAEDTPNVRYIHSLTDAHFGPRNTPAPQIQPKSIPSQLIGMTQGFLNPKEFSSFEPKRISKRVKREEGDSSEYEEELKKELDEQEKKIIMAALQNVEFPDSLTVLKPPVSVPRSQNSWISYEHAKYPYYNSNNVDPFSPLKYASNPAIFPTKSGAGMEFYDSRDRMIQCDDIEVNLEDVPKENSTQHLSVQPGEKKRIVGLGDKIRCMKIKYFGEDPLDGPFFRESNIKTQVKPLLKQKTPSDSTWEGSQQNVHYEVFHPIADAPAELSANLTDTRVIPVREPLPSITTSSSIRGLRPPGHGFPYNMPFSIISIPKIPKPAKIMTKVKSKYNCLQPVSKMIVSERGDTDDIMYDCPDITLIQTTLNGNKHFKIIPKNVKRSLPVTGARINQLRAGEVLESRFSLSRRKRSDTDARRTRLFPNRSLLDRMLKRPAVVKTSNGTLSSNSSIESATVKAKPDVKPTLPPYSSTRKPFIGSSRIASTSPRTPVTTLKSPKSTKPPVPSPPKKTIPKKQSSRISGLDFLTRYHKAKNARNKNNGENMNFFKASSEQPDLVNAGSEVTRNRWAPDTEVPGAMLTGVSYMRRSDVLERSRRRSWNPENPPVLLYVVDVNTGLGKWISQPIIKKTYLHPNRLLPHGHLK